MAKDQSHQFHASATTDGANACTRIRAGGRDEPWRAFRYRAGSQAGRGRQGAPEGIGMSIPPLTAAQRMQLSAALGPEVVRVADRLQKAFEADRGRMRRSGATCYRRSTAPTRT